MTPQKYKSWINQFAHWEFDQHYIWTIRQKYMEVIAILGSWKQSCDDLSWWCSLKTDLEQPLMGIMVLMAFQHDRKSHLCWQSSIVVALMNAGFKGRTLMEDGAGHSAYVLRMPGSRIMHQLSILLNYDPLSVLIHSMHWVSHWLINKAAKILLPPAVLSTKWSITELKRCSPDWQSWGKSSNYSMDGFAKLGFCVDSLLRSMTSRDWQVEYKVLHAFIVSNNDLISMPSHYWLYCRASPEQQHYAIALFIGNYDISSLSIIDVRGSIIEDSRWITMLKIPVNKPRSLSSQGQTLTY